MWYANNLFTVCCFFFFEGEIITISSKEFQEFNLKNGSSTSNVKLESFQKSYKALGKNFVTAKYFTLKLDNFNIKYNTEEKLYYSLSDFPHSTIYTVSQKM